MWSLEVRAGQKAAQPPMCGSLFFLKNTVEMDLWSGLRAFGSGPKTFQFEIFLKTHRTKYTSSKVTRPGGMSCKLDISNLDKNTNGRNVSRVSEKPTEPEGKGLAWI